MAAQPANFSALGRALVQNGRLVQSDANAIQMEAAKQGVTFIQQLVASHDDLRKRFAIAAGRPGAGKPDPGATVCSCFGVGVNQIIGAIRGGCHSVEAVGKELNAGTNCGSCRAEIRTIIDGCLAAAAE